MVNYDKFTKWNIFPTQIIAMLLFDEKLIKDKTNNPSQKVWFLNLLSNQAWADSTVSTGYWPLLLAYEENQGPQATEPVQFKTLGLGCWYSI